MGCVAAKGRCCNPVACAPQHDQVASLPPQQVCLTGASKAAAAKTALETAVPRGDFPAQLVQPDLAPAVWLLDEAAAAELSLVHGGGSGASGVHNKSAGQPQPDGSILYTF